MAKKARARRMPFSGHASCSDISILRIFCSTQDARTTYGGRKWSMKEFRGSEIMKWLTKALGWWCRMNWKQSWIQGRRSTEGKSEGKHWNKGCKWEMSSTWVRNSLWKMRIRDRRKKGRLQWRCHWGKKFFKPDEPSRCMQQICGCPGTTVSGFHQAGICS